MKKIFYSSLVGLFLLVSSLQANTFLAGLDFKSSGLSSSINFDTGTTSGYTLNLSGSSDDYYEFSGFSSDGWAAPGATYTNGSTNYTAGQFAQVPVTVLSRAGFAASSASFGGTSAAAQGFSGTSGIAFGNSQYPGQSGSSPIGSGVFTITTGSAGATQVNFDVAALAAQGQSTGTMTVNGTVVNVGSSASNVSVDLAVASGGLITFDLSGLSNGATFDNFMVAVPEPSTFVLLSGFAAFIFVAIRRRNKA